MLPKYFTLKELVDPETYRNAGKNLDAIVQLFDPNLFTAIDAIREGTGRPCIINNWHSGGNLKYRGYRPPNCTVGAKHSMHRLGKAADISIEGMSGGEARQWVRDNHHLPGVCLIRRMERAVSWLHIDTKYTGTKELVEFDP